MDKETLSNYGWIVILVLILAVLLALASPFGNFIAGAIKSTTAGFFSVNQNALGAAGIEIGDQVFANCEHTYESDVVVNCDTVGTITYTCSKCGHTYTDERTMAKHTFDDANDLNCNLCNSTFVSYAFRATKYDTKMGTTTATDVHVDIPETFNCNGTKYKVTSIDRWGFEDCVNLQSVTIPNSVSSIGDQAFEGCTSLKSVTIPAGVTRIAGIFQDCTSLETVVIPESMTAYGNKTYWGCTSLKNITIHEGTTNIPWLNFGSCKSLESITLPSSITKIGESAFLNCTALKTINFNGTIEQWNVIQFDAMWNSGVPATEVICSDGTVSLS